MPRKKTKTTKKTSRKPVARKRGRLAKKKTVKKASKPRKKTLVKKKKTAIKKATKKVSKSVEKKISKKEKELNKKRDLLVRKGKEKGFVTYDEILKEFPDIENNIIFLEELYDILGSNGIDVLESGGFLNAGDDEGPFGKKNVYSKNELSYDSIQM